MNDPFKLLNVLLVEDDPDIHYLVDEYLSERKDIFRLKGVMSLTAAYEALKDEPDIVLLDLSLPESRGLATLDLMREKNKEVPIVILTSLDDELAALEAVQKGAQEYLVKGHVNPRMLTQVLRHAVERHRAHGHRMPLQLIDPITALYNLQGFLTLSEQQFRAGLRNPNGHLIYLMKVGDVEEIRNKHGDGEAHHALKTTAEIIKESFRSSDIMARIGEDRFAIFPNAASPFLSTAALSRIRNSQTYYNARFNLYKISLFWKPLPIKAGQIPASEDLTRLLNEAFSQFNSAAEAANA